MPATMSMRIAPHLPYLRRYSRSLTGNQKAGDALVAQTIEAIIADLSLFADTHHDRVTLYRIFTTVYGRSTGEKQLKAPADEGWEQRANVRLSRISPTARQAFLLATVESFSIDEIAFILSSDQWAVQKLLELAALEIANQVATDIMIIEDEPLIALDIEQMVRSLGHGVTGIARTESEALALFDRRRPGMILADIQLADGTSGIDAVNRLLRKEQVPVIFITAFPERLLTGERPEPAFLVTKPFQPDTIKALISQALFFHNVAAAPA